jgi:hypothetical protein
VTLVLHVGEGQEIHVTPGKFENPKHRRWPFGETTSFFDLQH